MPPDPPGPLEAPGAEHHEALERLAFPIVRDEFQIDGHLARGREGEKGRDAEGKGPREGGTGTAPGPLVSLPPPPGSDPAAPSPLLSPWQSSPRAEPYLGRCRTRW